MDRGFWLATSHWKLMGSLMIYSMLLRSMSIRYLFIKANGQRKLVWISEIEFTKWETDKCFFFAAAFGCCLNYTGFIIAMSTYFRKMYAVAFSVTQAGVGVGLFFFGSLFQWLIERFGWRASFLLSGAIGFHFTLLGALVFPLRQPKNIATNPPEKDVLIEIAHAEEVVRTLPATATRRDVCREQLLHFSSLFWVIFCFLKIRVLWK